MFKPGDEVVCIDATIAGPHNHKYHYANPSDFSAWLVEGKQYTIRASVVDRDMPGVLLEEIQGPYNPFWDEEQLFAAVRFRKIVKKETSIDIFQRLTKVRELEPTA